MRSCEEVVEEEEEDETEEVETTLVIVVASEVEEAVAEVVVAGEKSLTRSKKCSSFGLFSNIHKGGRPNTSTICRSCSNYKKIDK